MQKRVMLAGAQKTFMVNAIERGLEKNGYEVVYNNMDKEGLELMSGKPEIYLLYLGDISEENQAFLRYIDEAIDTERFVLYLIGNREELQKASYFISSNKVNESYLRPLDVNELVEEFNRVVKAGSVDEEKKKKILVVDDDGAMLRMIRTWLSIKYRVYMASTGKIALSFLQSNPVDLVLLDYEMPNMNGVEVLKTIRSTPEIENTPVMFLTSKDDKQSVVSAAMYHPAKYLLKTMPKAKLVGAIDEYFE